VGELVVRRRLLAAPRAAGGRRVPIRWLLAGPAAGSTRGKRITSSHSQSHTVAVPVEPYSQARTSYLYGCMVSSTSTSSGATRVGSR
jgi:hypothetical protein